MPFSDLQKTVQQKGRVALVGAGPGDPDLLTVRALRLIESADVVLYDNLVSQEIIDLIPEDARKRYVGKRYGEGGASQMHINQWMVSLAEAGLSVVRLKAGDPLVFGRGGEELQVLRENTIPYEVVPGITAAIGCAAYSAIPLTHRDYAQSCTFVTAHIKAGGDDIDWRGLVGVGKTVVFYMGIGASTTITEKMIEHGALPELPVAIIEKGSRPDQRVITTTLTSLPGEVEQNKVQSPAVIIVGEVVSLQEQLAWFVSESCEAIEKNVEEIAS